MHNLKVLFAMLFVITTANASSFYYYNNDSGESYYGTEIGGSTIVSGSDGYFGSGRWVGGTFHYND